MRKAFWPLVVALGLIVAFGAIGTSSTPSANAEIDTVCVGEDTTAATCVWAIDTEFGLPDNCADEGVPVELFEVDLSELDNDDVIDLFLEEFNAVWICVELIDGNDFDLEFDSNDYGTWEEVICAATDGDPDFDEGDDECSATNGLGTDTLLVDCFESEECETDEGLGDVAALFVCEDEAGEAEVTITHDADSAEFRIICWGEADEADGEATALPDSVEIVPALGNTQYSLLYVKLLDEDGNPAAPGREVTWTTDNCEIADDERVIQDTLEEDGEFETFDDVIDLFEAFVDVPTPSTADDIEDYVEDVLDPDWDDTAELETFIEEPFDFDDPFEDMDTFTATILACGQHHDSEPGVANVQAIVEVIDGADLVFEFEVEVIGPPASVVVSADPSTSVRCGERVAITATIKDAKGKPVSEHTLVEAVTNFGGVLGGTGAVAGQQGLVTPVSSTVAETFGGVAKFWLLTSETHSGPYEVLVTTGGGGAVAGTWFDESDEDDEDENQLLGGLFSTEVITQRVSVSCTIPAAVAPAPAATVRAPSTGGGIVPPNTGDAGLADASGTSWTLFVIGGVAAFALAGVASVKFARR
jgi:hypothetical protein